MEIPLRTIGYISQILEKEYSHAQLDNLFMTCGAPGEPPEGNKLSKCQIWLKLCNKDLNVDALCVLAEIVKDIVELKPVSGYNFDWNNSEMDDRHKELGQRVEQALSAGGLKFVGGTIQSAGVINASKKLSEIIKTRDLPGIEAEFQRAIGSIDNDPPSALSAACAILEALCKSYIDENYPEEMPNKQILDKLWGVVSKKLKCSPSKDLDQDINKILSAMNSLVSGIASLRTHAGSAHGRSNAVYSDSSKRPYRIQPRHARLAVNSAHTLTYFLIETIDFHDKN